MRALRFYKRNDIRLEDIPEPTPKNDEIKIKVTYAAICGTDLEEFQFGPFFTPVDKPHPLTGVQVPVVLSHEFAGVVVEAGKDVAKVKVGDRVGCYPMISCGKCPPCRHGHINACVIQGNYGYSADGGFADYCVIAEKNAVKIPENIGDEQAALNEPTGIALNLVEVSHLELGDNIAIFGAGAIGLMALQIARIAGAKNVFVVDVIEKRLNLAKELGADVVINAKEEDCVEKIMSLTNGDGVDISFEVSGSSEVLKQAINATKFEGKITMASIYTAKLQDFDLSSIVVGARKIIGSVAHRPDQYVTALKYQADKRIDVRPLITGIVALDDLVEKGFKEYLNNKSEHIKILAKI